MELKEKDIIKVHVTGIQKYGIFVETESEYDGLLRIGAYRRKHTCGTLFLFPKHHHFQKKQLPLLMSR